MIFLETNFDGDYSKKTSPANLLERKTERVCEKEIERSSQPGFAPTTSVLSLYFEPSMDACSTRSDVISSIRILSFL